MHKPTPGPWHANGTAVESGPQGALAYVTTATACGRSLGEATANARLIASAPAMKEALEEVDVGLQVHMEQWGDHQGRLAALREIIAQALALTEKGTS